MRNDRNWIGNVQYEEDGSGNAAISDTGVTDFISNPLEVDPAFVQMADIVARGGSTN